MGKHFGELGVTVRGLISHKLSPFEQRPFAGALSRGLPNLFKRFANTAFAWVPPFVGSFLIYTLVEAKHKQSLRKNPRDYINEVDPNAHADDDDDD